MVQVRQNRLWKRKAMTFVLALLMILQSSPEGNLISQIHDMISEGRALDAAALAHRSLAESPESVDLQKALALAYRNTDSLGKAIDIYESILEKNDKDNDARLGLAITLSWADRLQESLTAYRFVHDSDPENLDAVLGIGQVYSWQDDFAMALEYYKKALELEPTNHVVYQRLGQVYLWKEDYAKAVRNYEEALALDPEDAETYVGLGKAYEWGGFPIKSLRYYEKALVIDEANTEAKKAFERVSKESRLKLSLNLGDVAEDDSGTKGNYLRYGFDMSRPLNDYVRPSFFFRYTDNKRGSFKQDYNTIGFGLRVRPIKPLQTSTLLGFDILSKSFKHFGVSSEFSHRLLKLAAGLAKEQLEPTKDINVQSVTTTLTFSPVAKLHLDGNLDLMRVLEDDNRRIIFSSSISYALLDDPGLGISFSHTYDSYNEWSPDYYSPENLRINSLGANLSAGLGPVYTYIELHGSMNTEGIQTLNSNFEIGMDVRETSSVSLQGGYFGAFPDYGVFSLLMTVTNYF